MPPEAVRLHLSQTEASAWRQALVRLTGVWLVLILAFAGDWLVMARQWWDSSTYNHILLVPPILAWMVSLRLAELRKLTPQVWAPGLILVGGGVLLWVLGRFAGFNLVQQAGAVLLLPGSLVALLGPRVALGLLFPLCYMLFLVPFGDEIVPQLQMITAVLTIALVKISGIPAVIDGVFIDTPAGLFEVAEACSGVKFLIAMIALGALVANVCFRSWKRRVLFMALCIAAPILANGVRAWATILAAQYVGAEKAGGFDHIVYGWFFFALVIAAVLGLSWRHFDRAVDDPMIDAASIEAVKLPSWLRSGAIGARLQLCCAVRLCLAARLGPERPKPCWRQCLRRSSCQRFRVGSGSTMSRPCRGNRVPPELNIVCWAAMPMPAGARSMYSLRSILRRPRAARRPALAKARCQKTANGPGTVPDRQPAVPSPTCCEPGAVWSAWPRPIIAMAIC